MVRILEGAQATITELETFSVVDETHACTPTFKLVFTPIFLHIDCTPSLVQTLIFTFDGDDHRPRDVSGRGVHAHSACTLPFTLPFTLKFKQSSTTLSKLPCTHPFALLHSQATITGLETFTVVEETHVVGEFTLRHAFGLEKIGLKVGQVYYTHNILVYITYCIVEA